MQTSTFLGVIKKQYIFSHKCYDESPIICTIKKKQTYPCLPLVASKSKKVKTQKNKLKCHLFLLIVRQHMHNHIPVVAFTCKHSIISAPPIADDKGPGSTNGWHRHWLVTKQPFSAARAPSWFKNKSSDGRKQSAVSQGLNQLCHPWQQFLWSSPHSMCTGPVHVSPLILKSNRPTVLLPYPDWP